MPDDKENGRAVWVAVIGAISTIIVGYLSYLAVSPDRSTFGYTGTVRNEARQPIFNAKVSMAEDENVPQLLRTDSEGTFHAKLSKTTQSIRVNVDAEGYLPYVLEAQPARSGPEEIELKSRQIDTRTMAPPAVPTKSISTHGENPRLLLRSTKL